MLRIRLRQEMNKAVRGGADFRRLRAGLPCSADGGSCASGGTEAIAAAWNIALSDAFTGSPGKIEDQLSHAIRIVV